MVHDRNLEFWIGERRRRRAHGHSVWTVETLTQQQQGKTRLLREQAHPKPSRWKERQSPRPEERPAKPLGLPSESLWVALSCLAPLFSWVSESIDTNLNTTLPSLSAGCPCFCLMTSSGENLNLFFFPSFLYLSWKGYESLKEFLLWES